MRTVLVIIVGLHLSWSQEDSYSFVNFRGPVSGQIQEIIVPGPDYQRVDYVAKPDYLYSYGVEDPQTGNSQTHQETRDGDAVTGEYKVLQADGLLRVVKYVADEKNGFRATVTYEKP